MKFFVLFSLVSVADGALWGLFGASGDRSSKPSTGFLSKRSAEPSAPDDLAAAFLAADLLDDAEAEAGSALQLIQDSAQVSSFPVGASSKVTGTFQKSVDDLVEGFSSHVAHDVSGDFQKDAQQQTDVPAVEPSSALPVDASSQVSTLTNEAADLGATVARDEPNNSSSASTSDAETPNTSAVGQESVSVTAGTKVEGSAAYSRSSRSSRREATLIESLRHMSDGDEAVECVTHCRYGEVRHHWRDCLDKCVTNHMFHSTFMSMLPAEHHDAHADHVEMPQNLKKKLEHKKQRSSEL